MGSADAGSGPEHGRGDDPGDDDRYADLPPVRVTVPDDPRDLDADVRAYYRELKRRAGPAPEPPPPPQGRTLDSSRPGRMIIGVFALLLIVASLAMMMSPRRQPPPGQAPLSTAAGADARGLGDGLRVLDLRVRVGDIERALLDLRPAVIALVPESCGCEGELGTIVDEVAQYQLELYLVEAPPQGTPPPQGWVSPADPSAAGPEQLRRIKRSLGAGGRVSILHDPSGRLVSTYSLGALTLVLVGADGTLADVRRGASELAQLDLKLAQLSRPGSVATESAPTGS